MVKFGNVKFFTYLLIYKLIKWQKKQYLVGYKNYFQLIQ
jgi:hypothetical protein